MQRSSGSRDSKTFKIALFMLATTIKAKAKWKEYAKICLPELTIDESEASMCDDFHIKIGGYNEPKCRENSNIDYFLDSAENIVVDGVRGIYYF